MNHNSLAYRPEVDGLRALAVVPVILFHAGWSVFRGGFVGVDVFFVISGYLITGILLSDLRCGRFSIVDFYERRARRILPALFVVLLLCLPAMWWTLVPADAQEFSQSLGAVVLFVSNFFFWSKSGYFDTSTDLKPLLHTWSLAVEEQYYLFFPLLLWALRGVSHRRLLAVLGGAGRLQPGPGRMGSAGGCQRRVLPAAVTRLGTADRRRRGGLGGRARA